MLWFEGFVLSGGKHSSTTNPLRILFLLKFNNNNKTELNMKRITVFFSMVLFLLISACGVNEADYHKALSQIDSLKNVIGKYEERFATLQDSISLLKFPADQRYNQIVKLVKEERFDEARVAIADLEKVFPKSKEAELTAGQLSTIEKREAEIKVEEERIKALGFKVFKDQATVNFGNKTCSFSGFTYGRTFSFDYVSDVDEYYYRTADKGSTYILANMSMTTKESYASTPSIAVYKIVDGSLNRIAGFQEEYASWSTYGAYIGNYSETSHDFSKVNTVRWKIAAEISNEESKLPLIILTSKDETPLDSTLSLNDVREKCEAIKILNRNKI